MVTSTGNRVDVFATSTGTINTLSAGLSGAGTVAISGAISLNEIANTVDAHVSNGANVTANRNINLKAQDTSSIWSLSGQAAGAGAAGIGGAAAYNEIGNTIQAYASGATLTSTADSISV